MGISIYEGGGPISRWVYRYMKVVVHTSRWVYRYINHRGPYIDMGISMYEGTTSIYRDGYIDV